MWNEKEEPKYLGLPDQYKKPIFLPQAALMFQKEFSRYAEQAKSKRGEDHDSFHQLKKLKRKQDTALHGAM